MIKKIKFNDIEYFLNEHQGKLVQYLYDKNGIEVKLTAELFSNINKPSVGIYAHSEGKLYTLDNPSEKYPKDFNREKFIKNGRQKIFNKVSSGQILRISSDILSILIDKKEFEIIEEKTSIIYEFFETSCFLV